MIVFSGPALDRAPKLRSDHGWLEARRADPRGGTVLMSEQGVWIDDGGLVLEPPAAGAVFLGLLDGRPLFADWVGAADGTRRGASPLADVLPASARRPRSCRRTRPPSPPTRGRCSP